jgi:cyanophycinase
MTAGRGTLALVGAGEFLDSMRTVDEVLLERAGGERVAILPTASAPDGADVPARWAEMGIQHFRSLGAAAVAVMALDRAGCQAPANAQAVRTANLIYFSGGKPDYLLATLSDTPVWEAVLEVLGRGGVVAGCSAGAMILGGWIPARPTSGSISIWRPAFGLVPRTVIFPHFDEIPRWITAPLGWTRPRRSTLLGIDGSTALVGRDDTWEVFGRGRVVVRGAMPNIPTAPAGRI